MKTKAGKSVVQASDFNDYSLDQYIDDSISIPIGVFYKSSTVQAIGDAVEYLKTKRFGTVVVPPTDQVNTLLLQATINRNKQVVVNFIYYNYKFPVNNESRPHTSEPWIVGDRIINLDTDASKSEGWVCTRAGTPGEWKATSYSRKWSSQVETVDALPDPSELQQGRQLLCPDRRGVIYCYICTTNEAGEYVWMKQNNLDQNDVYNQVNDLFNKKFSGNVINSLKGLIVNPLIEHLDDPGPVENVTSTFPAYQIPKASTSLEGSVKLSKSINSDSNHSLSLYNEVKRGTDYVVGDLLVSPELPKSMVLECVKSGRTSTTEVSVYRSVGRDTNDKYTLTDGTCQFHIYDNRWSRRQSRIMELVYPVGSIYINTTDVNPATLFGVGVWERFSEGKVLLGSSMANPLGSTGGVSSYRISMDQMPSHTHSITMSESGGHTHKTRFMNDDYNGSGGGGTGLSKDGASSYIEHTDHILSAGQHTHTITIGNTGGSRSVDNMPPYVSVSIWKRVS